MSLYGEFQLYNLGGKGYESDGLKYEDAASQKSSFISGLNFNDYNFDEIDEGIIK